MPQYKFATLAEFSQKIRETAWKNRQRWQELNNLGIGGDGHEKDQCLGAAAALESLAAIVEQSNLTVKS